jgi:hypothetical protein
LVKSAALVESRQSLNLANDFAAGGIGLEHLIKEAKEGAPQAKDALTTVGALVGLAQQVLGQQGSYKQLEMRETLVAKVLDAPAQSSQAGTEGWKERRMHDKYVYLLRLDAEPKI